MSNIGSMSFISVLYSLLLLMITVFSYHKAVEEQLCTGKRPGVLTYTVNRQDVFALSFNWGNEMLWVTPSADNPTINPYLGLIEAGSGSILSNKTSDTIRLFLNNINKTIIDKMEITFKYRKVDISEIYELNYYLDNKYFNVTCDNFGYPKPNQNLMTIKENGFDIFSPIPNGEFLDRITMECNVQVRETNCSMDKKYQGYYLFATIILLSLFCISLLASLVFDPVKELVHNLLKFLGKDFLIVSYCNPLTNSYGKFNPGEKFCIFSDFSNMVGPESSYFLSSNSKVKIIIEGGILSIIENKKLKFQHNLDINSEILMKRFLFKINIDENNWVTDGFNHYLGINDFISNIREGKLPYLSDSRETKKFKSDDAALILSNFNKWSKKTIEVMCKHNRNFFKDNEVGSFDSALFSVFKRRTSWYDKPLGVGNSQWKRYCSDASNMLMALGEDNLRTQYKKVKPLTQAAKIAVDNPINLEDIKLESDIKIEINFNEKLRDKMCAEIDEEITSKLKFTPLKLPELEKINRLSKYGEIKIGEKNRIENPKQSMEILMNTIKDNIFYKERKKREMEYENKTVTEMRNKLREVERGGRYSSQEEFLLHKKLKETGEFPPFEEKEIEGLEIRDVLKTMEIIKLNEKREEVISYIRNSERFSDNGKEDSKIIMEIPRNEFVLISCCKKTKMKNLVKKGGKLDSNLIMKSVQKVKKEMSFEDRNYYEVLGMERQPKETMVSIIKSIKESKDLKITPGQAPQNEGKKKGKSEKRGFFLNNIKKSCTKTKSLTEDLNNFKKTLEDGSIINLLRDPLLKKRGNKKKKMDIETSEILQSKELPLENKKKETIDRVNKFNSLHFFSFWKLFLTREMGPLREGVDISKFKDKNKIKEEILKGKEIGFKKGKNKDKFRFKDLFIERERSYVKECYLEVEGIRKEIKNFL